MILREPIAVRDFIALYAAAVSSIVFGWNLYRDLHNRAKLKVSVALRRISISTDGKMYAVAPNFPVQASAKTFVVISALNVGQRPVKINGWGGKYLKRENGKDSFIIVPQGMPKMLNEWESIDEFTEEMHDAIGNIKYICIRDASGREWKAPRRDLAKLKKDVLALQKTESAAKSAG